MPLRTISEQAFENYLKSRNFNYRYEEPVPGISTLLDYAININGTTVRFEVAEWEPKVPLSGFHGVDMYGPIRTKISGKKNQFRPYRDRQEPCCLVLVNVGQQYIALSSMAVLGAMRGDAILKFPVFGAIETDDSNEFDAPELYAGEHAFSVGEGCMLRRSRSTTAEPRNTTFSAIIVLCGRDVQERRRKIDLQRQERITGTLTKIQQVRHALDWTEKEAYAVPRVQVYDNVDARHALPESLPTGPYDERFGVSGDQFARKYVGSALAGIEAEEQDLGIL